MLTLIFITSFVLLFARNAAQILSTGNTALPACAEACPKLNQAVAACGGETVASEKIWSCFCQSGYLKTLYTSPTGICDAVCTDPAQNQLVMSWYVGNCGTDYGAAEHADAGTGAATTATTTGGGATTATTTSSSTSGMASSTGLVLSGSDGLRDPANADGTPAQSGSWLSNHWKWIIMLIILAVGLALLAWFIVWLKRRHERKQDTTVTGFNEGITMRSTPMVSTAQPGPLQPSSGRDSPVRTRDAFMPYGYGYSRSESRVGSRTNVADSQIAKSSPLTHGPTNMSEMEQTATSPASKKKRIYVREKEAWNDEEFGKR